jgi:periplasmic copper chaperone A
MRQLTRTTVVTALAAGLLVTGATAASAHVTVTPSTTTADSYTVLTFAFGHGCGESATTEIAIQMPEQVISVAPAVHPGWDVEKVMQDLETPVDDGHGGEYTERVAEVVYTAKTPVPNGYRDSFELSLKLPDAAGEALDFPTVQTCEEGETAWVQIPADGQSADDLESPAPSFVLTSADASGQETEADDADADAQEVAAESTPQDDASADAASDDAATPVVSWVALALGAAGLALGGLALARSRRAQG